MTDTKKKILLAALQLFAVNGYEAVSVSQIAEAVGITKGALYKHYKNKRDIFESIFAYVCQLDIERSKDAGVPEKEYYEMPEAFKETQAKSLREYMISQFYYWSRDEIACNFRKMLTLEQYKTEEMEALYQKVMGSGPLDYIENLFREMVKEKEENKSTPKEMAIEFYAPFYLLLSMADAAHEEAEKEKMAELYVRYADNFFKKYNLINEENEKWDR